MAGLAACQLDTPHWYEELTTIPEVGDIKRLAQKIHTSFDVPAVQCKALKNQEYTVSPVPKCLKRGMFLPDDPSCQDIWWKPQLLTLAYAWVLQYWVPLEPSKPCPLVMSVREIRWHIGKYTTISKHEVFKGLGNAVPQAKDGDTRAPPADSTTSPATTDIRDTQLSPVETQLVDDTISPSLGYKPEAKDKDRGTPPVNSTTSPAMADAKDTWSGPVETPLVDDTTVQAAEPNTEIQKNLPTVQGASPTELEDLVAPTAM